MQPRFKVHIQYHNCDSSFDGVFNNIDIAIDHIRHNLSDEYNTLTICVVKSFIP